MKKHVRIIALVLCVLCTAVFTAADGETLIHNFGPEQFQGYEAFQAQHPEVQVKHASVFYSNTAELSAAVVSRSVQNDLLSLYSNQFDGRAIMEKGYCVDLSGYPEIVGAVNRMYPRIREHCMADGKIYGLPWTVYLSCYSVNLEAWKHTGASVEDIPDSFAGMLDWIEKWLDRAEAEDIRDVNVAISDPFGYDRTTYPRWLTDQALKQYILQQQYAGAPLRFDEPELRELLVRCKTLGDRLYQQEETIDEEGLVHHYVLLEGGNGLPRDMRTLVMTRLFDGQPMVLNASMGTVVIPTTSSHQELAAELLCSVASLEEVYPLGRQVFFFEDAPLPEDPQYEARKAASEETIAELQKAIESAKKKGESTAALEENLEMELRSQKNLSPYLVYPEIVETYRALADGLFFPGPSVFSGTQEDMVAFDSLKAQYAAGSITVDELLSRLNEMARMIQAENQ